MGGGFRISSALASARGFISKANGCGRRFTARGSMRLGRCPIVCFAMLDNCAAIIVNVRRNIHQSNFAMQPRYGIQSTQLDNSIAKGHLRSGTMNEKASWVPIDVSAGLALYFHSHDCQNAKNPGRMIQAARSFGERML
jgi:hypothetical protein